MGKHLKRRFSSVATKLWRLGLDYTAARTPSVNIDNLTTEEYAYIAGLLDGEGSISFRRTGKKYIGAVINITNTSPIIGEYFLALGYYVQYHDSPSNQSKGNKPMYTMYIYRMADVKHFLEKIVPFLRIKQEIANLTIEFCTLRLEDRLRKELSQREIDIAQIILDHRIKGYRGWIVENILKEGRHKFSPELAEKDNNK